MKLPLLLQVCYVYLQKLDATETHSLLGKKGWWFNARRSSPPRLLKRNFAVCVCPHEATDNILHFVLTALTAISLYTSRQEFPDIFVLIAVLNAVLGSGSFANTYQYFFIFNIALKNALC